MFPFMLGDFQIQSIQPLIAKSDQRIHTVKVPTNIFKRINRFSQFALSLSWQYLDLLLFLCLARGVKRQRLLGGNPILFFVSCFCSCLVRNNSYRFRLDVVSYFVQCLCQVEPLGRLGESLVTLAVKNRNFSAHENCCNFYLESYIQLFIFADD